LSKTNNLEITKTNKLNLEDFKQEVLNLSNEDEKKVFTQKVFFHGIPKVFENRENDYYTFRKRISDHFEIEFFEILIVGSSKFGFSPYKFTDFSYDSDIDVVIFNERLFDKFFELICDYQYQIKSNEITLTLAQNRRFIRFLKYFTRGWMRPDLLPQNTNSFKELKTVWDDFFKSISHSKSEVGNYIVKGGLFKNHKYAEKYYRFSLEEIKYKFETI